MRYPAVAAEWHPDKNGALTPDEVSHGSNRKVWWLCKKERAWEASINSRTSGNGCPSCFGNRLSDRNRLSILHPDVAGQWHPTKNRPLKPQDVSRGSGEKVWWQCERGHEWEATVNSRTTPGQLRWCPACVRKQVSELNRLSTHRPDLAEEWHRTRNGTHTPENTSYGSNRKVWWRCRVNPDHIWDASPNDRNGGGGVSLLLGQACPPFQQSLHELPRSFEPMAPRDERRSHTRGCCSRQQQKSLVAMRAGPRMGGGHRKSRAERQRMPLLCQKYRLRLKPTVHPPSRSCR